jgi:hypothetical protein
MPVEIEAEAFITVAEWHYRYITIFQCSRTTNPSSYTIAISSDDPYKRGTHGKRSA